jgi:hypothetical protein
MKTTSITIVLQQADDGRMTLNHIIAGDVPPQVAANACRATADAIDRDRIRSEMVEEKENGAAEE